MSTVDFEATSALAARSAFFKDDERVYFAMTAIAAGGYLITPEKAAQLSGLSVSTCAGWLAKISRRETSPIYKTACGGYWFESIEEPPK